MYAEGAVYVQPCNQQMIAGTAQELLRLLSKDVLCGELLQETQLQLQHCDS